MATIWQPGVLRSQSRVLVDRGIPVPTAHYFCKRFRDPRAHERVQVSTCSIGPRCQSMSHDRVMIYSIVEPLNGDEAAQ